MFLSFMHLIYCNNALRLPSYEKLKNKMRNRVITSNVAI